MLKGLEAHLAHVTEECPNAKVICDRCKTKRPRNVFDDHNCVLGFIDLVKAAHPTRPVVAVLCWLGRCEAGGDSGDGGAGHADGAAASVAADGGPAKTKKYTKQKQSKSKKQRLTEAATAKGVELCVMDTSGLHMLHVRTTR